MTSALTLLLLSTLCLAGTTPAALQAIWLPIVASGNTAQEFNRKMGWYIENAGQELLREWVEMLERASSGDQEP
ncbi:MAG: hypothetical protein WD043_05780 [Gemmatimonadales bacterium]